MSTRHAPFGCLAALALLQAGCASDHSPASAEPAIPRQLLQEARPIGRGPRFQPRVAGPVLGRCSPTLGLRYGVHVEVFAANRVVLVARGIGVRGPLRFSGGRIAGAGCFGDLVTLEPTGLVLVRPRARRSLSDLFRSWGEPLSTRRLAGFTASARRPVTVYVDGQAWRGPPGAVLLRRHAEIVLEIGPHVPPHSSYTFPGGT